MTVLKREGLSALTAGFKRAAAEWITLADSHVSKRQLDPAMTRDEFHEHLGRFGIRNYKDLAEALGRGERTGSAAWNHPLEKYTRKHAMSLFGWCDPIINNALKRAIETQRKHGVNSTEAKKAWREWVETRDAANALFHGGERDMRLLISREFEARFIVTALEMLDDDDRSALVRITRGLLAENGSKEAKDLLNIVDGLPESMEGIVKMVAGDDFADAEFYMFDDPEWFQHVESLAVKEYAGL